MQAVQVVLAGRERLNKEKSTNLDVKSDSETQETESREVDPVQVSCNFTVMRWKKAS